MPGPFLLGQYIRLLLYLPFCRDEKYQRYRIIRQYGRCYEDKQSTFPEPDTQILPRL